MRFSTYLFIVILCLIVLNSMIEGKRGRGSRRRGRMRKQGSSRFLFYTNPRRKEYYDNPNGAQIIQASHFDYEFYLGHKVSPNHFFLDIISLHYLISRLYSYVYQLVIRITWFKDSIELDPHLHPYLQISEWKYGKDKIKSKLEIDPARQMDSGTYECMLYLLLQN
ncbi:unnamed protein product [Medioppia subpectinata]|uniref:Ig-like domain-containing protein n=1 Tax=Medioppia subpectinata TaxID=1979941 RepID=A0A7R9KIK0_9ACAR|nr:unnamed protein product [Medioppia subpectinata]CAG2104132.1 unnamed protein product [Medioppia subpectinata]